MSANENPSRVAVGGFVQSWEPDEEIREALELTREQLEAKIGTGEPAHLMRAPGIIQHLQAEVERWRATRQAIAAELEAKIRPLIGIDKHHGGYDCCGCSTYDAILDAAIAVVLRQPIHDC